MIDYSPIQGDQLLCEDIVTGTIRKQNLTLHAHVVHALCYDTKHDLNRARGGLRGCEEGVAKGTARWCMGGLHGGASSVRSGFPSGIVC